MCTFVWWSLPFLLPIIVYSYVLPAPFLWDDEVMVVGNPIIRHWSNFFDIWTSTAFGDAYDPGSFYRPVQIMSYMLDYSIWGLQPFGFRLSTLIIHLCSTALVWRLFSRWFSGSWIAVVIAGIFSLHPLGTEVVSYVSGRGDALMLVFALLALECWFRSFDGSKWWGVVSIIAWMISVFSKENLVILPLLLLASLWLFRPSKNRWFLWMLASLSLSMAMAFSVYRVMFSEGSAPLSWIANAPLSDRLMTVPWSLWTYIKLVFFPWPLHMEYHHVFQSLWHWHTLWFGLFVIFMGVSIYYSRRRKVMIFFWLWVWIGLSVVTNIVPVLASTLREHWMYFSMIGVLGVVGLLYEQAPIKMKRLMVLCGVFWVIFLFGITWDRNLDWSQPIRLYTNDVWLEPRSFVLHNNLGVVLFRDEQYGLAEQAFIRSIQVSPEQSYSVPYSNLGVIYQGTGQYDRAIDYFKQSIRLNHYQLAYENIVPVLWNTGKREEALAFLQAGLKRYPNSGALTDIYNMLQKLPQNRDTAL